jgi:hypothetical protein
VDIGPEQEPFIAEPLDDPFAEPAPEEAPDREPVPEPAPDEDAGGYRHWRCGRRRGHDGKHRFINYTWGGPGERVEYAPVEPTFENLRGELQRAPKRYGTPSRRQVRQKREKLAALAAERERSRTAASGGDA